MVFQRRLRTFGRDPERRFQEAIMATTPTRSVADRGKQGQPARKPLSAKTKAKLAASLDKWRAGLTPEAKAELAERNRQSHQQRWLNMSERERRDRLAGVKAWQRAQRDAKRAAAKAEPKASPKPAPKGAARATSVGRSAPDVEVIGPDGTSIPSEANNLLANPIFKRQPRRGRKAVSK